MKRTLLVLLAGCLFAGTATAQEVYSSSGKPLNKSQTDVKSEKLIEPGRLIVGGWGLFGIGSGVTNIGITPILGYRITDDFSAGIGFGYQYLHVKDYYLVTTSLTGPSERRPLNAHIYSPSVWARYVIWNNIFAHAEYEHNITSYKEYINNTLVDPPYEERKVNLSVPCMLLGGGLRQPVGARSSFVFMVLYDVLQNEYSPYRNTIAIRFGFNYGF